ncbi:Nn.00g011660.m01.CDS01 [Neocucurbitaria sp. VM-36]
MPVPSYNAMPLSKMFLLVRVLQAICMIIVIGITSNFVQMIVTTGVEPPKEFVGTLSVTCIATLYIMVSVGYYWSYANLGLLVMTGVDSLLLIAFIVCAVTLGKPMSFLNCYVIGKSSKEVDTEYAYAFVTAAANNLNTSGAGLDLRHWAGVTRTNCFQAKTVWGMAIALCILFTVSCALLPTLWYKNKKPAPKTVEEA